VRVKELFSMDAIFPETDWTCGVWSLVHAVVVPAVRGGVAHAAATRNTAARELYAMRVAFFILKSPLIFGGRVIVAVRMPFLNR
jgi:hypothetical protein